jgi:PPE-repeat protein
MEFITLPPEVTSALIHSGPGAESLAEASRVWQQLSTDLDETAGGYVSVLSSLTADWHGPATVAMVDAAAPYVTWLRGTAAQCQRLASSAQAAATAFGSTVAAVVPPAQVAANRIQLAQLLATNGFGKNLAAIAATEQQYQNIWVNNSAAMYRYQSASAQALDLPLFSTPPSIVDPGGEAAQATAVSTAAASAAPAAAGSAAAALPAAAVASPLSPIDALLQTIGVTFDPNEGWFGFANTYLNQWVSSGFPINMLSYFAQSTSAQALSGLAPDVAEGLSEGESALGSAVSGLADAADALGAAAVAPTAAMGTAISLGTLSAPPAATAVLTAAHMPVQLASAASPLPAGEADAAGFPMLPPLMAPPIAAGSGWRKRKEQKYEDLAMGLEVKGSFIPRSPSAG